MTSYSAKWFDASNFGILDTYRNKDNLSFLEIGSFEGMGTNYFIEAFLTGQNSTITCIDPWIEYSKSTVTKYEEYDNLINEKTYDIFMKNTEKNRSKTIVKRGLSKDILPTLTDKYDFIYVDGDHSRDAVYLDAIYSFPLLKVGGIMIFDDYTWSYGERSPKDAVDQFLREYKNNIEVIAIGYQVSIKKISEH